MNYAIYIPVGPGPFEIYRLLDLLDSLLTYAHQVNHLILVDDTGSTRKLRNELPNSWASDVTVFSNPREGRGNGSTGGLCVSDLIAFEWAQSIATIDFVLKLDTDSLLIHPIGDRIESTLKERPNLGMLGVVGDSFGPNRTFEYIHQAKSYLERLASLPRDLENVDQNNYPELRRLRREEILCCSRLRSIVDEALSQNAELGLYCQGGGYVVSRRLLDGMAAAGHFKNPVQWMDLRLGEDIFMATVCAALGLNIYDSSHAGSAFAIHPGCLPLSCDELLALNRSIIHSIKGSEEDSFRQFFMGVRQKIT